VVIGESFRGRAAGDASRIASTLLLGLLMLSAAMLCWRRLAGALAAPLAPAPLCAFAVMAVATAIAVRLAWRFGAKAGPRRPVDRLVVAMPSVGLLAGTFALSLPGTSMAGLVASWGLVAAEECWTWASPAWRRLAGHRARPSLAKPSRRDEAAQEFAAPAVPIAAASVSPADPPGEEITQQLTRSRTAEGDETLTGWLRVALAPGQRTTNVHLAFCPPFSRNPQVAVTQMAGPPVRIKTVQVLPYAARVDLKLTSSCPSETSVLLHFSAELAAPAASHAERTTGVDGDARWGDESCLLR